MNGCSYGITNKPEKAGYLKLAGQRFWEFISGEPQLYIDIIEPFGYQATERNADFLVAYSKMINRFTLEFAQDFCDEEGNIDWKKLVAFNSQMSTK